MKERERERHTHTHTPTHTHTHTRAHTHTPTQTHAHTHRHKQMEHASNKPFCQYRVNGNSIIEMSCESHCSSHSPSALHCKECAGTRIVKYAQRVSRGSKLAAGRGFAQPKSAQFR